MPTPPKAVVLLAAGSNRDQEAALALELAGAQADVVPLAELTAGRVSLANYQMVVVPGGFSYADALGAGKLLALDFDTALADQMRAFVSSGKPVLGVCNGFQALLKAGLLGGEKWDVRSENEMRPLTSHLSPLTSTLTFNAAGHFECRWVHLRPRSQACVWTRELTETIYC